MKEIEGTLSKEHLKVFETQPKSNINREQKLSVQDPIIWCESPKQSIFILIRFEEEFFLYKLQKHLVSLDKYSIAETQKLFWLFFQLLLGYFFYIIYFSEQGIMMQ